MQIRRSLEIASAFAAAFVLVLGASASAAAANKGTEADSGSLFHVRPDGQRIDCPLKHTDVQASISGPLASVTVRQDFVNESAEVIEAIYKFPLPVRAAIHGYEMRIGERLVKGKIARREEARQAYENALRRGQTAALLDQQRPNVFRQALANIPPGARVSVQIHYVELLSYENATYEFVFPMVVGPRYFPAHAAGAALVNPPLTAQGTRAGHDISLCVRLQSALPLAEIRSESHALQQRSLDGHSQELRLAAGKAIPNKDFILRYRLAARDIAPTLLTQRSGKAGYFSLILDPPAVRTLEMDVTPKELVFVIDTSGSMHGFPLEKAKEAMRLAMEGLNPRDTFNLITFAGDTQVLWPAPRPATRENLQVAQQFLAGRSSGGGTEMMKAIRAALAGSDSQEHLRVVCFMTDGYVGNETEILNEIRQHPQARVFSFGIGSSVNRYLLDKMAEAGRGEVEYVSLNADGSAAARRFHERVRNPLLTDIEIDWNGLPLRDLVPARIPDLFSAKPLIVSGRYLQPTTGVIRIRGKQRGRAYVRELRVEFPAQQAANPAVPLVWARHRIDALSLDPQSNVEAITQLGLAYGLMTEFTSYYAVEQKLVNEGGVSRTVEVPVEMPEGVSYEGIQGNVLADAKLMRGYSPAVASSPAAERYIRLPRTKPESSAAASGRVRIQVLLRQLTPDSAKELARLSFVADPQQAKGALFLTGSIEAAKLAELRRLPFVLRVENLL